MLAAHLVNTKQKLGKAAAVNELDARLTRMYGIHFVKKDGQIQTEFQTLSVGKTSPRCEDVSIDSPDSSL
jgi:hypothetical protein